MCSWQLGMALPVVPGTRTAQAKEMESEVNEGQASPPSVGDVVSNSRRACRDSLGHHSIGPATQQRSPRRAT